MVPTDEQSLTTSAWIIIQNKQARSLSKGKGGTQEGLGSCWMLMVGGERLGSENNVTHYSKGE